jgi:hypothetical protein
MPLQGQNILIVEPRVDSFVAELQRVLEVAGAESLIVRDASTARTRMDKFAFTAVVAHIDEAAIKDRVALPTLLYGTADVERDAVTILTGLIRKLSS